MDAVENSESSQKAEEGAPEYDRSTTGWEIPWVKTTTMLDDGTKITSHHAALEIPRPPEERVRCGHYKNPITGEDSWGDHRVTFPGTTCEEVDCHVPHAVNVLPGWHEMTEEGESFFERPGIKAIAAALEGWDAAGIMKAKIGSSMAWVAAAVALDALRDAGYEVVARKKE